MKSTTLATAVLAATSHLVNAASSIPTCGDGSKCPESSPCCSQYGQCGVGAYCLGGCDPRYSFDLNSCEAAPVCKSADYKLTSLDDVARNTIYLGDSSTANWVSSGTPVVYNDEAILLTMAPNTVGTLLTSTHYVWYGKICATMQSSQGQGVVTAFILMSDVQDEIDYEFVGTDVNAVQSNYYWQGILDYQNGKNLSVDETRATSHEYCIDWKPDSLEWLIDGNSMRTLDKSSTYNSTSQSYSYPQTPARMQLSLWPAGLSTNAEGTIEWAGGLVDWDSPYMQRGYYYAIVNEVTVECYDPPTNDGWVNSGSGDSAYYYTNTLGTNNTVAIGDNSTILASFLATGNNPKYNPDASSNSASASSPSSSATNTPASVPGVSGGGSESIQGSAGGSSSNPGSGNGGGSSSPGSGGSYASFDQGITQGSGSMRHGVSGLVTALLGLLLWLFML